MTKSKVGIIPKYQPHANQIKLHNSKKKEILIISAIRAGKTTSLVYDALEKGWNNPSEHPILMAAPVAKAVENLLYYPMVTLASELGILLSSRGHPNFSITLKNKKRIIFVSLHDETTVDAQVRGLNVSDIYLDEAALVSEYAIEVLRGRLLTTNGRLVLATTPKGMNNWIYTHYFKDNGEFNSEDLPYVDYIKYSLRDNPGISVEAVDRFEATHKDPLLYRQEILGEFVNIFGDRVYYSFDRKLNVDDSLEAVPTGVWYVGVDFNINKNAHIFIQKQEGGSLWVLDEGYGAFNTADLAHQIMAKVSMPVVIPDATGGAKTQGTGYTNFQLLRQAGIQHIAERASNPERVKRYSVLNAALCNARGQRLLKIHPRCKRLIHELEILTYRKIRGVNTDRPESQADRFGHITDALGYAIDYLHSSDVRSIIDPQKDRWRNFKRQAEINRELIY
jgi:phage terminase large subunit